MSLIVLAVLLLGSTPTQAQSLFDFLFGGTGSSPSSVAAPPVSRAATRPAAGPRGAVEYRPAARDPAPMSPTRTAGGVRYRTLCVRLCDGYYWPVSQTAVRSQFYRDAELCRSQCDSETRLFVLPSPGPDVGDAVDRSGLTYASLENAFVYRKTRVPGCVCRPVPWSAREIARHRNYAVEEALERRQTEGDGVLASEHEPPGEPPVDGKPVAQLSPGQPEPVSRADRTEADAPTPPAAASQSGAIAPAAATDPVPIQERATVAGQDRDTRKPETSHAVRIGPSVETGRVTAAGHHHIQPIAWSRRAEAAFAVPQAAALD